MKILISGSSGLIGSSLASLLRSKMHCILHLVRSKMPHNEYSICWDPALGNIEIAKLEGINAVIHLAGENIASRRWTKTRKSQIYDSRVKGTQVLVEALRKLKTPPKLFISASGINYYGNRGNEILTEDSTQGSGFLADLCHDWENASTPLQQLNVRIAHLRFGMVLSPQGGALKKMLLPFRLGLGGAIGDGTQFISWISIEDCIGAIAHILHHNGLQGAINCTSPQPITNKNFTKSLAKTLKRPSIFPLPALFARILLGEMADELLLASLHVEPKKLIDSGYQFLQPNLDLALEHLLHKK